MKHDVWPDDDVERSVADGYVPVLIDIDSNFEVPDRFGVRLLMHATPRHDAEADRLDVRRRDHAHFVPAAPGAVGRDMIMERIEHAGDRRAEVGPVELPRRDVD